ncbi:hypothetical protein HPB50_022864 [Hyalomma asiaticum]|uniref:Uncharacterized protein n=1 Tax=Hyalomma asiaticum TaxID=266040 RepID=A0ACB7SNQ3_HYAAI|nr:hypothetical protein HPB50_022864 [Hyalomma asiaticum]
MDSALGRVGRIVKIDSDGDFNVRCPGGVTWYFNPDCVEPVSDEDSDCDDTDCEEEVPIGLDGMIRDSVGVEPPGGRRRSSVEANLKMMPLHGASYAGNKFLVKMMAVACVNLNEGDKDGDTALHYAVYGNKPEMLELLINSGADVNIRNKRKYTPIHVAVNKQHVRCVRVLTNYSGRLDANAQDKYGDTPLHDAVEKKRLDILDLLLNVPTIDMNVKNKSGFNAFHQAAFKGNKHAVQRILSKKPEIADSKTNDGCSALHLAVVNNNYSLAKTLLLQGRCTVDLKNGKQQTALLLAVCSGFCDLVELLIEAGADVNEPDEDGNTPMHMSLMRRAEIKVRSLDFAMAPAISQIVNELLQYRTPGMDSALALACFLASRGGDLHRKNKAGQTPLDLAGGFAYVELLLIWKARNSARMAPTSQRPNYKAAAWEGRSCKVCLNASADVWLEPCGHRLYCSDCCRNMNGCLTCGMRITGTVLSVDIPAVNGAGSDGQRDLESRLKQLEEAHNCRICMERERAVAFLCGHGACAACAENLSACHLCRTPIVKKIALF